MVTWNQAAMTERALASIHAATRFPYRLIVIDNASDAETQALLDRAASSGEYGEMRLTKNADNIGWLRATNQGIAQSDAAYVCLMNTDIIAGANWLTNMVAAMDRHPEIGLANPRGNRGSENKRVTDEDAYARRLERERAGAYCELDHCRGFCMLIRRAVLDAVGALDEAYDQGFFEDNDFSRRAQQAGYICVRVDDAYVRHIKHQSFGKVPKVTNRLWTRNQRLFEERWGRPKRYLLLPRRPCADEVRALARAGSEVYVVANRFLRPGSYDVPHKSIVFLTSPLARLLPKTYFALKGRYFTRKGKIDEMRIVDAGTVLQPAQPEDRDAL